MFLGKECAIQNELPKFWKKYTASTVPCGKIQRPTEKFSVTGSVMDKKETINSCFMGEMWFTLKVNVHSRNNRRWRCEISDANFTCSNDRASLISK